MESEINRAVIATAMDGLARADGSQFVAAMANDFRWVLEGSTSWSGVYQGKQAVRDQLLGPLFAQFATPYRNRAELVLADGHHVVVLCRGEVETQAGERYDNSYCYVIRMVGGKMAELREYLDTALVDRVLAPRVAASSSIR